MLENQLRRNYVEQNFQEVFPRGLKRQLLPPKNICKARAVLTAEQAVMIYQIKPSNQALTKRQRISLCSVARSYGVSEKAVRDIWKGRTWLRETTRIDPGRPLPAALRSLASALATDQVSNAAAWWDKDQTTSYANAGLATACVIDAEVLVTGNTTRRIGSGWIGCGGRPWSTDAAAPLPESSRTDDPFHDDWRYWPDQESSSAR